MALEHAELDVGVGMTRKVGLTVLQKGRASKTKPLHNTIPHTRHTILPCHMPHMLTHLGYTMSATRTRPQKGHPQLTDPPVPSLPPPPPLCGGMLS